MSWEIVVGIETHAQLATRSKMFSGASTAFGAEPNTQASAVDIALPGVLPVPNRTAVEYAIRFGLAVGASINRRSIFARKNYFYPDLPKGYQISQFELPIVTGGSIAIPAGESGKIIRLTRAHLEEDAGKSLHEDFRGMTGIDLNRAGTPLLEIVSEPELRSAPEAIAYAKALHGLVRWIEICDGNMQEGSFRCDANVSVRRAGDSNLGTRCEIKNLNSFRFMERAIEYEARRQIAILADGGAIVQETRLYDPERGETRSMRTKEDAQDYRYFPDPDLLPLVISEDEIERIRSALPELPDAMRARFVRDYGLSDYDARTLTANRSLAEYYEAVASAVSDKKAASNWVMGDVSARLNEMGTVVDAPKVSPQEVAALINLVTLGTINLSTAKTLFDERWNRPRTLEISVHDEVMVRDEISAEIVARDLGQVSNSADIERRVDHVLATNAKQVADYRAGKDKAFNALVGEVMKATRGKANPAQVNEILRRKLAR